MSAKEMTVKTGNGPRQVAMPSPFALLQGEIDRVFDNFAHWRTGFDVSAFVPSMDVTETETSIEVATELPGIDENDIDISVTDDVLTIRGEKKAEKEEKKKDYRIYERSYGSFERSLSLPAGVKADAIKASLEKGVLKITLPKPAASQAQKVKINAS